MSRPGAFRMPVVWGVCSVCGGGYALRLDGMVRAHGPLSSGPRCAGSGYPPGRAEQRSAEQRIADLERERDTAVRFALAPAVDYTADYYEDWLARGCAGTVSFVVFCDQEEDAHAAFEARPRLDELLREAT